MRQHGSKSVRLQISHASNKFGKKKLHKAERQQNRRVVAQHSWEAERDFYEMWWPFLIWDW